MTINGINGTNGANEPQKTTVKADANAKAEAENKKISQELSEGLSGATRKNAITENDKKDLIKHYREMGYSRSQAEALFDSKAEKLEKMSRKDAKAWVKDYMEKNGCSKKEAKAAFKQEHGYSVPLSLGQKMLRGVAVAVTGPIGYVATLADGITGGKLGVQKFMEGQGNNDAKYVAKQDPSEVYHNGII